MAADFPLDPETVKKFVKKARSKPIGFGFNPGTDGDDEWLAAHKTKSPEMMGKLAQAEGAGTKSAFGTFKVEGSEVHLTCFRTVPQLAKKFKKYLKRCKVKLNVVILDPNGQVIDSDVEVLKDWFDEVEDAEDVAEDAAEAVAEAMEAAGITDEAPDVVPDAPPVDPAPLIARLKALQPKLPQVPPTAQGKLADAFKAAVELIRSGQTAGAAGMIDQIEAVVARLLAMAATTAPPPPPPPPPPPRPTEDPSGQGPGEGADPRPARLREVVDGIRRQALTVLGDGAGPILDALDGVTAQIDAGEIEAAMTALRAAQARLREAQAAREKWEKARAILAPQIAQALAARSVADPEKLRSGWQFVQNLVAEGNFRRALDSVPGLVAQLRTPMPDLSDAPRGEPDPVPQGTVAFQKSRVLWVAARDAMLAEAEKLADAIVAASSEDEDRDEIAAAAREIVEEVRAIDTRLQDILDDITNAEPGERRETLKTSAVTVIGEYRTLLSQGVFPQIDQNPFTPVSVAARARSALEQVARTIAA